jgi:hypothetical protein
MGGVVIFNLFVLLSLASSSVFAKDSPIFPEAWYQVQSSLGPVKVSAPQSRTTAASPDAESLPLLISIKKFFVIKTDEGFRVRFEPVCEKNSKVEVEDLTKTGGGVVQEKLYTFCESTLRGAVVQVILSGMVYDTQRAAFADETPAKTRQFFSHLHLSSKEIIFGPGDFNLGYSRDLPLNHWVAELSTDSSGGGRVLDLTNPETVTREGFVAAVRYGDGR